MERLYTDKLRNTVREALGNKVAEAMKVKYKSESWWMRLGMRVWPQLKKASGVAGGRTVYVNDNFKDGHFMAQATLLVHEATHVKQYLNWGPLQTLSYGIGSPWLLLLAGIPFIPVWWLALIAAVLIIALSTTGWVFPHIRAWWEGEAYVNGFIQRGPWGENEQKIFESWLLRTFKGSFYFWMGGFWARKIVASLMKQIVAGQKERIKQ